MIEDLDNVALGICLITIGYLVYKIKQLKKRFIELLSEKDKQIDKLEKKLQRR